jgi:L-lactate dehydrogenase complex protein LldG
MNGGNKTTNNRKRKMNEILEKIKKYSTPLEEKLSFIDDKSEVPSEEFLVKKFEEETLKVGSKVIICKNSSEAAEELEKIILGYSSAVFNNKIDDKVINGIKSKYPDKKIVTVKEINEDLKSNLSKINVSVSIPEYLIAESGTAVMRSSVDEPRLLSVLSEVSVIFAKKEQIIPSMSAFLKKSKENIEDFNKTSAYIFITGPSRTADIEKNLVIGVHGPGELFFMLY